MQQRLIGSLTEIYATGGGNSWLTENYPTNFHTFFTRRVLAPGDSPDRYREVNSAERAKLEAADALWAQPSAELIERWNARCFPKTANRIDPFGQYNPLTGYFESGCVKDITKDEALTMLENHPTEALSGTWESLSHFDRIMLPVKFISNHAVTGLFGYSYWLKSVSLYGINGPAVVNGGALFFGCTQLEEAQGVISIVGSASSMFYECRALRRVSVANIKSDISFVWSPLLEMSSVEYAVNHADNTTPIAITLHPDVFAALTDELIAKAAAKNISLVSA